MQGSVVNHFKTASDTHLAIQVIIRLRLVALGEIPFNPASSQVLGLQTGLLLGTLPLSKARALHSTYSRIKETHTP